MAEKPEEITDADLTRSQLIMTIEPLPGDDDLDDLLDLFADDQDDCDLCAGERWILATDQMDLYSGDTPCPACNPCGVLPPVYPWG